MNSSPPTHTHPTSPSITQEISRFESVHPSIYAIYELIENLEHLKLAAEIREHVVNIEDSFVNSQEWTLSRTSPTLHLGLLGAPTSPKSTLVHRYLTSQYLIDNSPEGGRFKKQIYLNNTPHLLLIRDEGGPPELQFTHWLDVLILVAGCHDDVTTCFSYASRINNYRALSEMVVVLMSTTSEEEVVNLFKKIPHRLFQKVDPKTGENVEEAFMRACSLVVMETPVVNRKNNRRRSNLFPQKIQENVGLGRSIPLKQGYLLKKSFKLRKYKKKYIILTEEKLSYYDNINNYMECKNNKFLLLMHANAKSIGEKQFSMTTVDKVFEFEASNREERDDWVGSIQRGIFAIIGKGESVGVWSEECADCGWNGGDVNWIVINFGVVVCIGCSGGHRGLGCHVSRVRSGVLDFVSPWILRIPSLLHGNTTANNKIYEANLPQKPITPHSTPEEKARFIKRKYAHLEFVPFLSVSKETILKSIQLHDFVTFMILMLRVEKYCLFLWVEDILRAIFKAFLGEEEWVVTGAWVQVVLWNCEEMDDVEKGRLRGKLLGEEWLGLGEGLRGVVGGFL